MPTPHGLSVSARFAVLSLFASTATLAHAPHGPFDNTRFAPIKRFGPSVGVEVLARGLTSPLKAVAAPGEPNRLYVVDQPGKLWMIDLNSGDMTVVLDISAELVTLGVCGPNTFDERGFLGVAFHPDYADNGRLYTYYSVPWAGLGTATFPTTLPAGEVPDHQNVVVEWTVSNPGGDPPMVDPTSRRELLRVDWPQFNHNAGDLAFGPDGKLYISMGDGGGADDADGQLFTLPVGHPNNPTPTCGMAPIIGHQGDGNAQKLNTPLGKILRIDVDGDNSDNEQYGIPDDNPFVDKSGAVAEIWAYGFRNPFRFSFDRKTLIVGDVGQNDIEEVDVVVRGGNYGWNIKEGTLFFNINGNAPGFASRKPPRSVTGSFKDPIAQYDTHHEGHAVQGGYVYRGKGIPSLRGKYVFGDFSLLFKFPSGPHDYGRVLALDADDDEKNGLHPIRQLLVLPGGAISLGILGVGQDAHGELYMLGNIFGVPFGTDGLVLKLVPAPKVDVDDDDDDDD
jgi:glucose/arabinose dehydrogenase